MQVGAGEIAESYILIDQQKAEIDSGLAWTF